VGGGFGGGRQNASSTNVMFFDQFADEDLAHEEQRLKDSESNAGKIQQAIKNIINISRESLRLVKQEERETPPSDEQLLSSEDDQPIVFSSGEKISRFLKGPVLVENVDVDSSQTGGAMQSSKTTVFKTVEPAFNEQLSQKMRGSLASSSKSSMRLQKA
jgi:hypothetical protein